ncbi:MAG TPA: hypothetical protein VGN90_11955 [Pyrinomonadaceae bacterium]|jgi:hypothetical protein|nr:hypothetical protein [Pyrinomonadaceae bacterium]
MAETKIVPYAQQRSVKLASLLATAKLQLAQAQTTTDTERGKLEAATSAFAALEETIAGIRKKLAAVPTPADGDLLLAQLEQAIIASRGKQAEITAAKTAVLAAQSQADAAGSDVTSFSAQLASNDTLLKQVEPAGAERDRLIAALEGPLSTINSDAAKAIDETKVAGATYKKAKKRIEDDLPKPLLDRALKRRDAAATRIANTIAARQTAENAATKERNKNGGLAAPVASFWLALVLAEAIAKNFVNSAQSRFDQANAKLAQVADRTVAALTPEQIARLNLPDPVKTDRKNAAGEDKDVAALRQTLEDRQKDLSDAVVAAKADPADAAKQAAVGTASGKVDTAKQNLDAAEAAYRAGNAAIMNAWEAAVPDPTWRLLNDYAEAVDTLEEMADPAALSQALKDAEATLVAALVLADGSSNVLVDLETEQAQRAAREESALQNSAATLFGALRGDN